MNPDAMTLGITRLRFSKTASLNVAISDEQAKATGRLLAAFSALEEVLDTAIVVVASSLDQEAVEILMGDRPSFSVKMDRLKKLFRHRQRTLEWPTTPSAKQSKAERLAVETAAEFDELIRICEEARKFRNTLAHSSKGLDAPSVEVTSSPAEIEEHVSRCGNAVLRLFAVVHNFPLDVEALQKLRGPAANPAT